MITLRRSFYTLLFITLLVSFLLSFIIFFIPLNDSFLREQRENFQNTVNMKANTDGFILRDYVSMARSLGSRTTIRKKLLDYHLGSVSLTELSSFTSTIYADGAAALNNLVYAGRSLPDGKKIAEWGDGGYLQNNTLSETGIHLLRQNEKIFFLVIVQIEEKGKNLGYDACVFNGDVFLENNMEAVSLFEITDTLPEIPQNQDSLVMAMPIFNDHLFLRAAANPKIFAGATLRAIQIVLFYSFVLYVFISVFSYFTFYKFVRNLIDEHIAVNSKIQKLLSEKELLLKEVHHRIKNNMSTIYGLLKLQAGNAGEPMVGNALNDAGNRIQSMMILYDRLFRASDFTELPVNEYLPPLIDEILSNFNLPKSIIVKKEIDSFVLNTNCLQPLGILVNELLTNIAKYAFTGRADGIITVSAKQIDNIVTVVISDNGIGMKPADSGQSTGLGLVLVKGMAKQLGGTLRTEQNQGTKYILQFKK